MKAVRTNVIDMDSILTVAIEEGGKLLVCLLTDKAAYTINAMGITMVIEDKVVVEKFRNRCKTKIHCICYNVI